HDLQVQSEARVAADAGHGPEPLRAKDPAAPEVGSRDPWGAARSTTVAPHLLARVKLEAANVTMQFAGLVALDDVSFEVEKGAVVGLIGPNGSGKTTLLNVISGALRPTAGEFSLNGTSWNRITPDRAARLGIRRTFQNIRL